MFINKHVLIIDMQMHNQDIISRKNESPRVDIYLIVGYAIIVTISILLGYSGGNGIAVGFLFGVLSGLGFMVFIIGKYDEKMPNNKVASLLGVGNIESYKAVEGAMQYLYDVETLEGNAMIVNENNLVYVVKMASKADLKKACELSTSHGCNRILFVKNNFHGKFVGRKGNI